MFYSGRVCYLHLSPVQTKPSPTEHGAIQPGKSSVLGRLDVSPASLASVPQCQSIWFIQNAKRKKRFSPISWYFDISIFLMFFFISWAAKANATQRHKHDVTMRNTPLKLKVSKSRGLPGAAIERCIISQKQNPLTSRSRCNTKRNRNRWKQLNKITTLQGWILHVIAQTVAQAPHSLGCWFVVTFLIITSVHLSPWDCHWWFTAASYGHT